MALGEKYKQYKVQKSAQIREEEVLHVRIQHNKRKLIVPRICSSPREYMDYHDNQMRFPVLKTLHSAFFNLLVNTLLNSYKNYTIPRNILYTKLVYDFRGCRTFVNLI